MFQFVLRVVMSHLRQTSHRVVPGARFGAVRVAHRFGAGPIRDVYFRGCVIDGVLEVGLNGRGPLSSCRVTNLKDLIYSGQGAWKIHMIADSWGASH